MCRKINSLDENHIKTVLNDTNWAASLAEQDINNAVSSFVKIFTAAQDKIAPIRSQRTRKRLGSVDVGRAAGSSLTSPGS